MISDKQVTFRAVSQRLYSHLFSAELSDVNSHKKDEMILLSIIDSLEYLLSIGRVIERIGDIKTPGDIFQRGQRKRKSKDSMTQSLTWHHPTVRFYDEDCDLPPDHRKTYEINVNYHTADDAVRAELNIHCVTLRCVYQISMVTMKGIFNSLSHRRNVASCVPKN